MTDAERIADLERRVRDLEENIERVQPWLLTVYHDMLKLQMAAVKGMTGKREEASDLVDQVAANAKILEDGLNDGK